MHFSLYYASCSEGFIVKYFQNRTLDNINWGSNSDFDIYKLCDFSSKLYVLFELLHSDLYKWITIFFRLNGCLKIK